MSDWPLHITVVPPFLTEAPAGLIAAAIGAAARAQPHLAVVAGRDALFGRRHDIPVSLIEPSADLTTLHLALVAAIRPFAAAPDEPAFTGGSFSAHVTHKSLARVHPGEPLTLTQLALVDMLPRTHAAGRTVLAAHTLH